MYFACRHHTHELMLRAVVEIYWPESKGPDMPTYKRFQRQWPSINQGYYTIGLNDIIISQALTGQTQEVLDFVMHQLQVIF